MGYKKEDEHITIPMPVHETSYQSSLPSKNANPKIMLDETSQLTLSGDAPSTTEPPPHGDAPLSGVNKSIDDQWTPKLVCLFVVVPLFLLSRLVAYLISNKDVTEDATEETQDDRTAKFLLEAGKIQRDSISCDKIGLNDSHSYYDWFVDMVGDKSFCQNLEEEKHLGFTSLEMDTVSRHSIMWLSYD
ncbi:hypothetical protein Ancab_012476 [Ancistrocladus abbreviatus]